MGPDAMILVFWMFAYVAILFPLKVGVIDEWEVKQILLYYRYLKFMFTS